MDDDRLALINALQLLAGTDYKIIREMEAYLVEIGRIPADLAKQRADAREVVNAKRGKTP